MQTFLRTVYTGSCIANATISMYAISIPSSKPVMRKEQLLADSVPLKVNISKTSLFIRCDKGILFSHEARPGTVMTVKKRTVKDKSH